MTPSPGGRHPTPRRQGGSGGLCEPPAPAPGPAGTHRPGRSPGQGWIGAPRHPGCSSQQIRRSRCRPPTPTVNMPKAAWRWHGALGTSGSRARVPPNWRISTISCGEELSGPAVYSSASAAAAVKSVRSAEPLVAGTASSGSECTKPIIEAGMGPTMSMRTDPAERIGASQTAPSAAFPGRRAGAAGASRLRRSWLPGGACVTIAPSRAGRW